ncbi:recombinase family protein [Pseudonocardia hydrocarbonoxydans]|uniref:Recombinase domain-containing protein n=1 Tax=Pseudonocardia hydrocarbonoxydans TaxID=76726 RepID=A0A4Y3WQ42_9PSEU|nr:recombinase family protein [Pseudonocardia hydrocarbonoxydans]GEC21002.1 hypothetical protein PHY01_32850 [Pseudonocardia hydrocarbonoxydans]
MKTTRKRAAIYARISADPTGSELGVTDQVSDCQKLAVREDVGWVVVGEPFVENDVSAYKKRKVVVDGEVRYRVVRPVFADLLAGARAGAFDAILVHDLDRMVRDPRDLEDLVELVEHHGIETRSVTGSLNLRSDGDVTMARVLVAMANKSSRDTARRVKRAHRRNAEAGGANGGRAMFGFRRMETGALKKNGTPELRIEVEPREADAIRDAVERVLAGASLYEICRSWDEAGFTRPYGGTWRRAPSRLKSLLVSARVAGIPICDGEELRGVEAQWPAIISVEKLDQVRAVLNDPARRTNGHRPVRNSPLSGLIRCECGSVMRSTTQPGPRGLDPQRKVGRVDAFRCASSSTAGGCFSTIRAEPVEEAVLEAVVRAALECDLEALSPDPEDGARIVAIDAELARVEAARADLALLVAQRSLTASSAGPALSGLAEQEAALRAERGRISQRVLPAQLLSSVATDLVEVSDEEADARAAGVAERFVGLDLGVRRALIRMFVEVTIEKGLRRDPGERVVVRRASSGERVRVEWPAETAMSFTNLSVS